MSSTELKTEYSAAEIDALWEKARDRRMQDPAKPMQISASKIKRFELCPRAWYAESVLHAYTESKATQAGRRIHQQIEDYYKKHEMLTGAAATAIRFYPLAESSDFFSLEHPFRSSWAGASLAGVIDLLAMPGTTWPKQIPKNTLPRIMDLKTSSNPDEYCIKQQQLPEDRQLLIYAKATMERFNAPLVEISQVQIKRSAPFPGRMLTPEMVTETMIAAAEEADRENVTYMQRVREELPKMTEVDTPETLFQRKLPCENVFGKRCAYYETCHGAGASFSFARAAQTMDVRVTTEAGLLSHMKAETKEQSMSGITSNNASNAYSPAPEGGAWSVDPVKGSAVWEGMVGPAKIVFRSKGQVAMISVDGGAPEKLAVAADFPVDPTTGRGSVEAIRKHILYPALERMRNTLGLPSMFAPVTPVTQKQAPPVTADQDVFAAMAAERKEQEQQAPAQADPGRALEELQALYPTIKADHLLDWLAQGMDRNWLLTVSEEEFLQRMQNLPGVGKAKAQKRLEFIAPLRKPQAPLASAPAQASASAPVVTPAVVTPAVAAAPVQPPTPSPAPAVIPQPAPAPEVQVEGLQPFRLFIRCAPLGEPTVAFEDLISPLLQSLPRQWHSVPAYDLPKEIFTALGNLDDNYLRRKARGRAVVVSSPDAPLWRAISQGIIEYSDSLVVGL